MAVRDGSSYFNYGFGGSNLDEGIPAASSKPVDPITSIFGGPPVKNTEDKKGKTAYLRRMFRLGRIPIEEIRASEREITRSAPDYAQLLANQVSRGELSKTEATDRLVDFGMAYDIPDIFKTAEQFSSTVQEGVSPESSVAKYRPFQEFAAKQLGLSLSEEDVKSTEAAARALGKTSPEAFSQFLGQTMMSSPEFIRKNPLAFTANLPFGGQYGVGYQTKNASGKPTFTGTFRFNPNSTVNYS